MFLEKKIQLKEKTLNTLIFETPLNVILGNIAINGFVFVIGLFLTIYSIYYKSLSLLVFFDCFGIIIMLVAITGFLLNGPTTWLFDSNNKTVTILIKYFFYQKVKLFNFSEIKDISIQKHSVTTSSGNIISYLIYIYIAHNRYLFNDLPKQSEAEKLVLDLKTFIGLN